MKRRCVGPFALNMVFNDESGLLIDGFNCLAAHVA